MPHPALQVHGKTGGEAQEWVRACLGTVGRGSGAQQVRDEILNIMHRNNVGEKRGTWMEVSALDSADLSATAADFEADSWAGQHTCKCSSLGPPQLAHIRPLGCSLPPPKCSAAQSCAQLSLQRSRS